MLATKALCGHIKATFAFMAGDPALDRFIGKLNNLSDGIFLKKTAELSMILAYMIQGKDINPLEFHTFSFKENEQGLIFTTSIGFEFKPKYVVNDPFLYKWLFEGKPLYRDANRFASAMKLKSAVLPRLEDTEPSLENVEKHRKSISGPFTGNLSRLHELSRKAEDGANILLQRLLRDQNFASKIYTRKYFPIPAWPQSDTKITVVQGPRRVTTISRKLEDALYFGHTILTPPIKDLINRYNDEFWSRVIIGEERKNVQYDWKTFQKLDPRNYDNNVPLQSIRFIPEAGGKERVVTVSNVVLQSLTYNLGQVAKTLNSYWRIQGVDSHEKTTHDLAQLLSLNKGKRRFYSIDASNFTDRLPKEFSFATLRACQKHGIVDGLDIASFEVVCNSPVEFMGNIIYYSVGTPMGTFPSFPLASFANGMLVWIATSEAYNLPLEDIWHNKLPCKVIGDDIVIWDDMVANQYLQILKDIGVETSPSKSIISNYYVEMCSKLIDSTGVYQQKKINTLAQAIREDQFISQYDYYGNKLVDIFPETEYMVYVWNQTPKPIGVKTIDECDLPEEAKYLFLAYIDMYKYVSNNVTLNRSDIGILSYRRDWIEGRNLGIGMIKSYGEPIEPHPDYKVCPIVRSLYRDMEEIFQSFSHLLKQPIINMELAQDHVEQFHRLRTAVTQTSILDSHIFGLMSRHVENHIRIDDMDYSNRDQILCKKLREMIVILNRVIYDYTHPQYPQITKRDNNSFRRGLPGR